MTIIPMDAPDVGRDAGAKGCPVIDARNTTDRVAIELLDPAQVADRPELRAAWEAMVPQASFHYVMYRSPAWWDHLVASRRQNGLYLGVARDAAGTISALLPLQAAPYSLTFDVGRRTLGRMTLSALSLLGGEPILGESFRPTSALWDALLEAVPQYDAVFLKSVAISGNAWNSIVEGQPGRGHYTYIVDGVRPLYGIGLPSTFREYLAKFTSKTRYNLYREVKMFTKANAGRLELVRIEQPDDVRRFLAQARSLMAHSWKSTMPEALQSADGAATLEDIAARQLLRSYLLLAGDVPCAFVIGYQYGGVYHYADVGYDARYARHSPGKVLLYLLLQDLFHHQAPREVSFGIGGAEYKELFANNVTNDASVLVLGRRFRNQMRSGIHGGFQRVKNLARVCMRQVARENGHRLR